MITEDFVSLEVAKLLKEKGFSEPVHYEYHYTISVPQFHKKAHNFNGEEYANCETEWFSALTIQMSMKWLREMYKINIEVYVIKNYDKKICEYTYTIMDLNFPGSDDGIDCCNKYKTYEEACEAGIKYCLEKLI